MAKQTQNNEKIKYNKFPLRKINFILMAVFGLMIVLGFILMAGSSNGEEFNPDIFSTRRIVVGRCYRSSASSLWLWPSCSARIHPTAMTNNSRRHIKRIFLS